MKMLMLRFTKLNNVEGDWWDSNLIILNGPSGVHIEMPGTGNSATTMQSMTGMKFVSNYQDYFGEVWDKDIPHIGFGQVIKFRVRKLPWFPNNIASSYYYAMFPGCFYFVVFQQFQNSCWCC